MFCEASSESYETLEAPQICIFHESHDKFILHRHLRFYMFPRAAVTKYHKGWFRTKEIYSLTVLEAGSLRLRCWQKASLVAQWLRIRLPMQGTWVRALVREDPTCHGATKPVRHNYWACVLEPTSHNYWACLLHLLKPTCLEPVLHNKGSHRNEKPMHLNEE